MFRVGDYVIYTPSLQDDDIVYAAVVTELTDNPDVITISYQWSVDETRVTFAGPEQLRRMTNRNQEG